VPCLAGVAGRPGEAFRSASLLLKYRAAMHRNHMNHSESTSAIITRFAIVIAHLKRLFKLKAKMEGRKKIAMPINVSMT
jgi:hypothetical protein